ncbi:MAG: hypothetical protein ACKV2Q_28115 [Planctomycetaceae bacterium]
MNGPRFTWPNDSTPPRESQRSSDIPEDVRQRTIATIRDALAHDGLPANVAEQFKQQLSFWESVRGQQGEP